MNIIMGVLNVNGAGFCHVIDTMNVFIHNAMNIIMGELISECEWGWIL